MPTADKQFYSLSETHMTKKEAAKIIGISERTLYRNYGKRTEYPEVWVHQQKDILKLKKLCAYAIHQNKLVRKHLKKMMLFTGKRVGELL
jgi:predicted transcriptional regulator YdeE